MKLTAGHSLKKRSAEYPVKSAQLDIMFHKGTSFFCKKNEKNAISFNCGSMLYRSAFQPFSSRGTSQEFLIMWRNLNTPYSTIYSIFREPSKELAEPRLKNTALSAPRCFYATMRAMFFNVIDFKSYQMIKSLQFFR